MTRALTVFAVNPWICITNRVIMSMFFFKSPRNLASTLPDCLSSDGKESAYNAGDLNSIPGSRRAPGEGNGNPLQLSCLENSMDRGAWQATVPGVAKSRTWLSSFHFMSLHSKAITDVISYSSGVKHEYELDGLVEFMTKRFFFNFDKTCIT